jgi:ABC-2 type transport system ATP-binding protein
MSITEKNNNSNSGNPNDSADSFAIEVNDIRKIYKGKRKMPDVKVVDGISFHVKKGEVFGLLGTNGAGKTTTISMLTGTLLPTEGTLPLVDLTLKQKCKK